MVYEIGNKEEMKKLRNAMEYKVDPARIIDPEAETVGDIKDSYVGKYVAKCDICGQLVYLESDDLTDAPEYCPYCRFDNCLTLVGQISALPVHDAKCDNVEYDGINNDLSPREVIYGKCYKDGKEKRNVNQ